MKIDSFGRCLNNKNENGMGIKKLNIKIYRYNNKLT